MANVRKVCVLTSRLELATRVELGRLCTHLGIETGSERDQIKQAYLDAADNSIFKSIRRLVPSEAPTYFKALVLIYKKLRPYREAMDEFTTRFKRVSEPEYQSHVGEMDELELEDKILAIYREKYKKTEGKVDANPRSWRKVAKYIPGVGTAGAGAATTLAVITAARAPFAALGPSALAGPVGIALGVVMVGWQLSAPSYTKLLLTTIELMLINQRIENMPKD